MSRGGTYGKRTPHTRSGCLLGGLAAFILLGAVATHTGPPGSPQNPAACQYVPDATLRSAGHCGP